MAKQEAEWSNGLDMPFLKKHGYLGKGVNWRSGTITWTNGFGEKTSSIGITVKRDNIETPQERTHLNLRYTHTSSWDGQKSDMDFNVEMTTTPCRYGGKRYWFICPLTKNGMYCGRRIGVIYGIGKWYGCRQCGEIAYASQMRGGKYRGSSVTCPDIEKAEKDVKRYYYRGKPTRKYQRVLRLNQKLDDAFILMAARFGHKDLDSLLADTERLQK